jgi:hypothetical protein
MRWDILDDLITRSIRVGGLVGVSWEAIGEHADRPYLLFLFACMMGVAKWDGIATIISMLEKR